MIYIKQIQHSQKLQKLNESRNYFQSQFYDIGEDIITFIKVQNITDDNNDTIMKIIEDTISNNMKVIISSDNTQYKSLTFDLQNNFLTFDYITETVSEYANYLVNIFYYYIDNIFNNTEIHKLNETNNIVKNYSTFIIDYLEKIKTTVYKKISSVLCMLYFTHISEHLTKFINNESLTFSFNDSSNFALVIKTTLIKLSKDMFSESFLTHNKLITLSNMIVENDDVVRKKF